MSSALDQLDAMGPNTRCRRTDLSTNLFSDRYTRGGVRREWQVYIVNEVRDWIDTLDDAAHTRDVQAIDTLAEAGPSLGRPLVDTIHGSSIANLKELRPGTVRILFAFDP
jgi:Phage derived protein Gp49-like (DUF891)